MESQSNLMPNDIKVLAIQNFGSSGTLLLHSLLDFHPQTISLPALYGNLLYDWWDRNSTLTADAFLSQFLIDHQDWFDSDKVDKSLNLHKMGESENVPLVVDRIQFSLRLRERLRDGCTSREFVMAIYLSYHEVVHGDLSSDARYLIFPIHCQSRETALRLIADFKNVSFIHMVRDLEQDYISMLKHFRHHGAGPYINHVDASMSQIYLDHTIHCGNRKAFGSEPYFPQDLVRSAAICLEDLHRAPREVLGALVAWMGISWDERLLESTFNGLKWWNRSESNRQSGLGIQVLSRNQDSFTSKIDRLRLRASRCDLRHQWGYEAKDSFFSRLLAVFLTAFPFRGEGQMFSEFSSEGIFYARIWDCNPQMPWIVRRACLVKNMREPGVVLPRWRKGLSILLMRFWFYIRIRKKFLKSLFVYRRESAVPLLYDKRSLKYN